MDSQNVHFRPHHSWLAALPATLTAAATALVYDPSTTVYSAAKTPLFALGAVASVVVAASTRTVGLQVRVVDGITAVLFALCAWAAVTVIWTPSAAWGLSDLTILVCAASLFTAGRMLLAGAGAASTAMLGVAASGLFVSAVTVIKHFASDPAALNSTIGNPNHVAAFVAATTPPVWWATLHGKEWTSGGTQLSKSRILPITGCILATGANVAAIALTGCLSALTALTAAAPLFAFRSSALRGRAAVAGATAAAVALISVAVACMASNDFKHNFQGRAYLARLTTRIWLKKPATGVGIGGYALAFPEVQATHLERNPPQAVFWTNAQTAHCEPLSALAELGVPGAALLLLLFGLWIRSARVSAGGHQAERGPPQPLRRAAVACLAALGVTSLAESSLHQVPILVVACIMLAVLSPMSIHRVSRARGVWSALWSGAAPGFAALVWVALALGCSFGFFRSVQQYRAERMLGHAFSVRDPLKRTRILRRAETTAPVGGRIRFYFGVTLLEAGNPARARAVLQRSLAEYPNLGTHLALGNAWMALDRPDLAAAAYKHATRLNPRYAAGHRNLAAALYRLGRTADAERALRRARRIWPGHGNHGR